jgi:hypothetical protein
MRIAVYSAIMGKYEHMKDPWVTDKGVDYLLFSDRFHKLYKWDLKKVPPSGLTNRKAARCIKILSHQYLPDYDYTIWIDGNFRQQKSLLPLIEGMTEDILILEHPSKKCVYTEAEACISMKRDHKDVIEAQIRGYEYEGYPVDNGMVGSGLIIRKNTEAIKKLNEVWWEEVVTKSGRDQLSFNYSAYITGLNYNTIPFDSIYEYFDVKKHGQPRKEYE